MFNLETSPNFIITYLKYYKSNKKKINSLIINI